MGSIHNIEEISLVSFAPIRDFSVPIPRLQKAKGAQYEGWGVDGKQVHPRRCDRPGRLSRPSGAPSTFVLLPVPHPLSPPGTQRIHLGHPLLDPVPPNHPWHHLTNTVSKALGQSLHVCNRKANSLYLMFLLSRVSIRAGILPPSLLLLLTSLTIPLSVKMSFCLGFLSPGLREDKRGKYTVQRWTVVYNCPGAPGWCRLLSN